MLYFGVARARTSGKKNRIVFRNWLVFPDGVAGYGIAGEDTLGTGGGRGQIDFGQPVAALGDQGGGGRAGG